MNIFKVIWNISPCRVEPVEGVRTLDLDQTHVKLTENKFANRFAKREATKWFVAAGKDFFSGPIPHLA